MELELSWRVRSGRECRNWWCREDRRSHMAGNRVMIDGHDTCCKRCRRLASAQRRVTNPEYMIDWRRRNADKVRQYAASYYAENCDRIKASAVLYRSEHADARAAYNAAWRAANPDYFVSWLADHPGHKAAWMARNPDRAKEHERTHNYRSRARRSSVQADAFSVAEVFEQDGYLCYLCGEMTDPKLPRWSARKTILEHKVPLSRGGTHTRANVATACWECNTAKGAKTTEEYLRSKMRRAA